MSRARPDSELIDPKVLNVLLRTEGWLTVEALALRCGMTAPAVQRELHRLREAGCTFDEHPHYGLRLLRTALGTWVDYLRFMSGSDRLVEVYRQTTRTQDVCRRLLNGDVASISKCNRAVVVADEQTAGRGRLGRRWHAPAGATLAMSRVRLTSIAEAAETADRLTFAAAVAVADAVEGMLDGRRCGADQMAQ